MIDFPTFFRAIHGYDPFPWQAMLAERLRSEGVWPRMIDLPTASGKTAAIDAAVWALADEAAAGASPEDRKMPRRIWFVVDRRIVVDEAAERATKIQQKLLTEPALAGVRDVLQGLSGTNLPLAVDRLRGGGKREVENCNLPNDAWHYVPTQPAVITSTVDQLGSRLLFRGYGMGKGMWPIHAALAGNDSLILLDEAHIAEPLRQTLTWVEHHRRAAAQPIRTPWQFAVMTATPQKADVDPTDIFPRDDERADALDHPLLQRRGAASKRARLILADKPAGKTRKPATLVPEAVAEVARCLADGRQRVAVMVNRIDSALSIEAALRAEKKLDAEVLLLTGRTRPVDRNALMGTLADRLKAQVNTQNQTNAQPPLDRPIVLVTTQCLEVGADFDFDGLVTECASLDALRQRFGRLDRLGRQAGTAAAVLAWRGDLEADEDPIYGTGLKATWQWLTDHADRGSAADAEPTAEIDFGIDALPVPADMAALLAPKPDAPVMMPAYLDAWCQREPAAEAEVALFLHGIRESDPQVSVVFRADLVNENAADDHLIETVKLLPPTAGEMLPVRLGRLLSWLQKDKKIPTDTDLTAEAGEEVTASRDDVPPARFVRYRGRTSDETDVLRPRDLRQRRGAAGKLRGGDVVVLPWAGELPALLGRRAEGVPVDAYEVAARDAGARPMVRLNAALIASRDNLNPETKDEVDVEALSKIVDALVKRFNEPEDEEDRDAATDDLIAMVKSRCPDSASAIAQPKAKDILRHPMGGIIVQGPRPPKYLRIDPFGGDDDAALLDQQQTKLDDHAQQVADVAADFAAGCLPQNFVEQMREAGLHHDDGKCDIRFQALLRREHIAWPIERDKLLAKSGGDWLHPAVLKRLRESLNYPEAFRHEMVSLQLAEARGESADLPLHLLASHHGHARPFAPIVLEDDPPDLDFDGTIITGKARTENPPHRLGSGVAERFWRLTRQHGWWGLAYLETMLRLADFHASAFPQSPVSPQSASEPMDAQDAEEPAHV